MNWKLTENARNVHTIKASVACGKPLWALFLSDLHWDNPACDRSLLKRHLDEAVEYDAPIFVIGDMFCLMQGKYDPRSSKDDVRPEHQRGDYLDSVVETAAEWFKPYAKHLAVVGRGNHEESVLRRHETDLIERFTQSLRHQGGISRSGGYGGWLRFQLNRGRTSRSGSRSMNIYYHHGFGGGGPVTRGSIDWSRYDMQVEADAVVAGHVHFRNRDMLDYAALNDTGRLVKRTRHFIRCGTYKDEYKDGYGGFHVEKGRGPRSLGGWWMRLMLSGHLAELKTVFQETD